jgi:hypothetical protein
MSFKNNYRVRKRESESMATLGGARVNFSKFMFFEKIIIAVLFRKSKKIELFDGSKKPV